ncbi:MAG: TonB-dependent receptor plug domain-containing protein [Bacteroidetes bacterium]|nr:TonB-dependent receptor plug domain-containing protein [Bacteroidota bacterium]
MKLQKAINKLYTFFIFLGSILLNSSSIAQTDTTQELGEVIVTGMKDSKPKQTSLNIEPYKLKDLEIKSPLNLSDALAKLPGISQISTGGSISKPVIRGLYGNRILVVLSGLRFDNQQWQDEHGLGLSQIGIDRIEVIRGSASLLYGTDALGGVINIIEEKPTEYKLVTDINTRFFSNSLGTLTDIGILKRNKNNSWRRLRIGFENHADYTDGNGNRVLNSRNKGYYLKAGFGKERKNWKQENSYNFSFNQYGFRLDGLGSFFSPDARFSRKMAGPHHNVILNIVNSQNTFSLPKSTIKLNAGFQSNVRMEDEGGGQISLNMHLFSILENLRWEKPLNKNFLLIANHQFTFENNTNYGGRIIIPDANLFEGNLSLLTRYSRKKINVEAGVGGNIKRIATILTRSINNIPGSEIQPFTKNKPSVNGMVGFSFFPNEQLNLKSNIATGFRAANLYRFDF